MAKKYYAVRYKDGSHIVVKSLSKFNKLLDRKKHKAARGFDSYGDAEVWCKDPSHFPSKKCVYAVKEGKTPGIYYSEQEFNENFIGVSKAKGKAFYTEEGAREWLGWKKRKNSKVQVANTSSDHFYKKWWSSLRPKLYKIRLIAKFQRAIQRFSGSSQPWFYCKIKAENPLIIYTDASYKLQGTGYAAIIIDTVIGTEIYVGSKSGAILSSSNAELYAIVSALKAVDSSHRANIEIRTDCLSLIEAADSLKFRNQEHPFRTDLWKDFYNLSMKHNIKMTWVKGHNGELYNTQCDWIAKICASD